MCIKIFHNYKAIDIEELIDLYIENGWGSKKDYRASDVEKAFSHSTFAYFATENNKTIGFVRGFSDKVFCSWIAEILVLPDEQRKGIGSLLLAQVKKAYGHTAIYTEALKSNEHFFEINAINSNNQIVAVSRRATK